MQKLLVPIMAAALLAAGCASDDGERFGSKWGSKEKGTAAGAAGGAATGAVISGATGGNVLGGAAIGGVAGGLAGYFFGDRVFKDDKAVAQPSGSQSGATSLTSECDRAKDVFRQAVEAQDLQRKANLYEQGLNLCPSNAYAHNDLGTVYLRMGKPDQAREEYRKALALNPDMPETRRNLELLGEVTREGPPGRLPTSPQHVGSPAKPGCPAGDPWSSPEAPAKSNPFRVTGPTRAGGSRRHSADRPLRHDSLGALSFAWRRVSCYVAASCPEVAMRTVLVCLIASFLGACAGTGPQKAARAVPSAAPDAAPVRHIGVYVLPYYRAAATPDGRPMVAVGRAFDPLLASTRREDVVRARDLVRAEPRFVTPMTLMVLAIRLYDVGERDEGVFWFYAARDRYVTLSDVLEVGSPELAQVEDAVRNFAVLAGPFFNSYAFCDRAKQQELRLKALKWVEQHPYQALFLEQLPARPGDRAANLKRSLAALRAYVEKERRYLEDPANLEEFTKARRANQVDAKFCWS